MGSLKPGATMIYERANGIIYGREMGADPSTRKIIGYESGKNYDLAGMEDRLQAREEWKEIFEVAKTNPALQEAVERVKLIYRLIKQNER